MGGATFSIGEVVPALVSHSAPRPEVGAVTSGFSLTNRSCGSVGLVVFAPLLGMAAAVAMETGALCPAPRVFTEALVFRPEILSGFPFPAPSFGLSLASLQLRPVEEKAVLLFRIWPVRPSLLLGCSNRYSNPGSWGRAGLWERTETFHCRLFGTSPENLHEMSITCVF